MNTDNILTYVVRETNEVVPQMGKITDKFVSEREVKLIEEIGELAQAVLSEQGTKGCGYKGLGRTDVLKEITDVLLVSTTLDYCKKDSLIMVLDESDIESLNSIYKKDKLETLKGLSMSQFGCTYHTTTQLALYFMKEVYQFNELSVLTELCEKVKKWKSKVLV